jgi:hypothetical protein
MSDYHIDKLGFEVAVGDFVCGYYGNNIEFFKVVKLTPKMICLHYYKAKPRKGAAPRLHRRYAQDMIKLSEEQTKRLVFKVLQ